LAPICDTVLLENLGQTEDAYIKTTYDVDDTTCKRSANSVDDEHCDEQEADGLALVGEVDEETDHLVIVVQMSAKHSSEIVENQTNLGDLEHVEHHINPCAYQERTKIKMSDSNDDDNATTTRTQESYHRHPCY
jgi:hypothetical protein